VRDFYLRYLAACNDHDFGALGAFVAPDVVVNGVPQGLDGYVAGLRAVVEEFPDYRWEPVHLLIDGDIIAAHFADTGTQVSSGRPVRTQEFAFYRVAEGLIAEVWVTADDLAVREQLSDPDPGPGPGRVGFDKAGPERTGPGNRRDRGGPHR
jgi:predicted ester cyclase